LIMVLNKMKWTFKKRNFFPQYRNKLLLLLITNYFSFFVIPDAQAGSFEKGSTLFSFHISRATSFGSTYDIYGLGVGYYVVDGLELALNYTTWQGGDPDIEEISPSVRYVIQTKTTVDPYVGAFYRKTKIERLDDLDAYGVRYGVYIASGNNVYLGIGGVYIKYQDCTKRLYNTCSDSYAEFSVGFSI